MNAEVCFMLKSKTEEIPVQNLSIYLLIWVASVSTSTFSILAIGFKASVLEVEFLAFIYVNLYLR